MPTKESEASLYRLVLEHGDFGIHNTSIATDAKGEPLVTSLYDWETAYIVPAFLSDPLLAAGPVDLITGEHGEPCVTRIPEDSTPIDLTTYAAWAQYYMKVRSSLVMQPHEMTDRCNPFRNFTIRRLTTSLLSKLQRTYATYGLPYEIGEEEIRRNFLVALELGQRNG